MPHPNPSRTSIRTLLIGIPSFPRRRELAREQLNTFSREEARRIFENIDERFKDMSRVLERYDSLNASAFAELTRKFAVEELFIAKAAASSLITYNFFNKFSPAGDRVLRKRFRAYFLGGVL